MTSKSRLGLTALALGACTVAAHAEPAKLEGTVIDVFGHRIVVEGPAGKTLVDLGPKAKGQTALKQGDKVTIDGNKREDEMRAERVTLGDGKVYEVKKEQTWMEWLTGKKPAAAGTFTADEAKRIAADKGYSLSSEPVAEKKHFVANASKDGKSYEIDIHADGRIVPNEQFGVAEAKKLAADKGYTLTSEPKPERKHFVADATKDGQAYQLDLHRDGTIKADTVFSADSARKEATDGGYEVIGDIKLEKKHYELLGKKDGAYFELHAHRDGLKKIRTVDKTDIRWGPMIP